MNQKDDIEGKLDPEPTAEERAEAEALARALQPGTPGAAPPDDALAAAALLRHARRTEDAANSAHVQERIAAAATRAVPAVDSRRPRRRWLLPALLVPAMAAALAIAVGITTRRPASVAVSASLGPAVQAAPAPPLALLEAQARAAHAGADLAALDRQMRDYRKAYYAAVGGTQNE